MKKIFIIFAVLGMLSCTSETYESGDGDLSYLRADFVEMHTAATKLVDSFVTDEDDAFELQQYADVAWAERPDTLYRALAYYNKVGTQAQPHSFQPVYVLRPKKAADIEGDIRHDPVGLESTWLSANGKYINMGLLMKVGQAEGDALSQVVGVTLDSESADAMALTFIHDQGGVPEYYTQRLYVSIPVSDTMRGKTITLRIQTYSGPVVKTLQL